jgi:predicted dehydrogenase
MILFSSCSKTDHNEVNKFTFTGKKGEVRFMTIDPGHFHAALVQKNMYEQVSPEVFVYAPEGPDVQDHLNRINGYNTREEKPTHWKTRLYTGDDFLQQMISQKPGNVMVTSGNNQKKTEYIKAAVEAGIHVFADKPMAINTADFELLKQAFESAEKNHVLLYDIMTERFEITTILQRELSGISGIFGDLESGSAENPAITKESVHHFFKYVSGNKIKRPAWFFDVNQQGEGIVDVTTHLVDLIQWECFPGEIIDYTRDIDLISARRWATKLTSSQFNTVTRLEAFPDYLKKDLDTENILNVYSNGEIIYKIRGVHAKVSVTWNYQAPEGTGDTHYSMMRGSKSNLIIRQGQEQNFKPVLYIEPVNAADPKVYENELMDAFKPLSREYPGIALIKDGPGFRVEIPERYKIGHEAHFTQVTKNFLTYLVDGKLPGWEVPNMIAKYYITTNALAMAKEE